MWVEGACVFRYFGGMLLAGDLLCIPHDPYMSHVTLGYLNLKDKTLARQPALRRLHTFRRTLLYCRSYSCTRARPGVNFVNITIFFALKRSWYAQEAYFTSASLGLQ